MYIYNGAEESAGDSLLDQVHSNGSAGNEKFQAEEMGTQMNKSLT